MQRICVEQPVSSNDPLKFGYNVKWTDEGDHFKVSVLGKSGKVYKDLIKDKNFVEIELENHLKQLSWSELAISKLLYVILSGVRTSEMTLNCETGNIRNESLDVGRTVYKTPESRFVSGQRPAMSNIVKRRWTVL